MRRQRSTERGVGAGSGYCRVPLHRQWGPERETAALLRSVRVEGFVVRVVPRSGSNPPTMPPTDPTVGPGSGVRHGVRGTVHVRRGRAKTVNAA